MTRYLKENVYEAACQRLETVFNDFDNVYVSFSGGKDSSVLLYLCLQVLDRRNDNRKIGLFHLDYEAQYSATTKHVEETFETLRDRIEPYWCCVPFKVTTCTSMFQQYSVVRCKLVFRKN